MSSAIEVTHLTRRYGSVTALDDVSLTIERDAITGLLGRNGAGKTVLMSIMTAQDMPTSGKVLVNGVDPGRDERVLSDVSFIRELTRWHVFGALGVATALLATATAALMRRVVVRNA